MGVKNITALLAAVAVIAGAIFYLERGKVSPPSVAPVPVVAVTPEAAPAKEGVAENGREKAVATARAEKAKKYETAKEITTPDGFINTGLAPDGSAGPITIGEFIGKKVVLLDIWTYSCINCQRTIPYLNSWWGKYKNKGLVIIGLHTPEFEFEKEYENVRAAVKKFGIGYPVVLDNDYSTWRAYRNQYWPRKYLIDIDGFIIYDHIGEGGYEETERRIQKALAERMERLGEEGEVGVAVTEEKSAPRPQSPETYFGAARNSNFGNGERGAVGRQELTVPKELLPNTLYLGGAWNIEREYTESAAAGATIEFRYRAKEVYLVGSGGAGVRAKVYQDGELVRSARGEDVAEDGSLTVSEDRLYTLIKNAGLEEHVLKIEIESPGLKAFTFTFG